MNDSGNSPDSSSTEDGKKQELKAFLFITILLFPILSVMVVGGYGFLVWISQMIFGPPTGV